MAARISFIHSPDRFLAETQQYGAMFMPVWAYTLAAYIDEPEKYNLQLFDTRFEAVERVPEADLFVFSGINQDYETIVETHSKLKAQFPASTFVIGGPISWSLNEAGEIAKLEMFDHVFIGDGEETFPQFLKTMNEGSAPRVISASKRFDVSQARPFYRPFLNESYSRYYGAVIEVSRGCPFLCEFCDIRVMPDNNKSHNKNPDLIVTEMDRMYDLGVRQVLFACDNFIGIPGWAEEVCDQILKWQKKTGKKLSLYTWLTINLTNHPRLMKKMRHAGFDMLFIGVESFAQNTLLEMAK